MCVCSSAMAWSLREKQYSSAFRVSTRWVTSCSPCRDSGTCGTVVYGKVEQRVNLETSVSSSINHAELDIARCFTHI
jgi:positive regulator of sigma E activity